MGVDPRSRHCDRECVGCEAWARCAEGPGSGGRAGWSGSVPTCHRGRRGIESSQSEGRPAARLPSNGHSAFAHTGLHVRMALEPPCCCQADGTATATAIGVRTCPRPPQPPTDPAASTVLGDNTAVVTVRDVSRGPQPTASIMVRDASNDRLQPRRVAISNGGLVIISGEQ